MGWAEDNGNTAAKSTAANQAFRENEASKKKWSY